MTNLGPDVDEASFTRPFPLRGKVPSVVVFRWASGAAVGGFYDFYGFNQPR